MAGYDAVVRIEKLKEALDSLGLMLTYSKHDFAGNSAGIIPKDDDSLPIYSRDAELYTGTIQEIEHWVRGIYWARDYDRMLFGKAHNQKRERKEQDVRNKQLVNILKQSDKVGEK